MCKKIIYPIIMLLISCSSTSNIQECNEPLIKVYGKIMNRQFIEFLEKDGSRFKITRFSYTINLTKDIVLIGGGDSIFYDVNSEHVDINHYRTSESFRKRVNSWNGKYYRMISPDFIEVNNKRRMEILDSLCVNKNKSLIKPTDIGNN